MMPWDDSTDSLIIQRNLKFYLFGDLVGSWRCCYFPSCFQQKPEEVKEAHDTSLYVVRILSEICRMKFDDICGLLDEDRDCDIRDILQNALLRRFPSSPKIPFIISDIRVQSDEKTD